MQDKVKMTVFIDDKQSFEIEMLANFSGLSKSEVVRLLLREKLDLIMTLDGDEAIKALIGERG